MEVLEQLLAGPWGPVLIFSLRIVDVSLATLRILLSMRNVRIAVPIIGFFEVLIWIFAVGAAIRNLNSGWHLLGYASGFATGSLVGMWLEEKLAFGLATVRIISRYGGVELADALREKGYGVTETLGQGRDGRVEIIDTVVQRRQIQSVLRAVEQWDPDAFVMVDEPRSVHRGWLAGRPRKRIPTPTGWPNRRVLAVRGRTPESAPEPAPDAGA